MDTVSLGMSIVPFNNGFGDSDYSTMSYSSNDSFDFEMEMTSYLKEEIATLTNLIKQGKVQSIEQLVGSSQSELQLDLLNGEVNVFSKSQIDADEFWSRQVKSSTTMVDLSFSIGDRSYFPEDAYLLRQFDNANVLTTATLTNGVVEKHELLAINIILDDDGEFVEVTDFGNIDLIGFKGSTNLAEASIEEIVQFIDFHQKCSLPSIAAAGLTIVDSDDQKSAAFFLAVINYLHLIEEGERRDVYPGLEELKRLILLINDEFKFPVLNTPEEALKILQVATELYMKKRECLETDTNELLEINWPLKDVYHLTVASAETVLDLIGYIPGGGLISAPIRTMIGIAQTTIGVALLIFAAVQTTWDGTCYFALIGCVDFLMHGMANLIRASIEILPTGWMLCLFHDYLALNDQMQKFLYNTDEKDSWVDPRAYFYPQSSDERLDIHKMISGEEQIPSWDDASNRGYVPTDEDMRNFMNELDAEDAALF